MQKDNRAEHQPPESIPVRGKIKGEEATFQEGPEPGRGVPNLEGNPGRQPYRTARDATSINPKLRDPIDPAMPNLPPP